jgi:ABC-type transport system involved in multi-copper enzyme maturation permease subunit
MLWAQQQVLLPGIPGRWRPLLLWLLLFGEPSYMKPDLFGAFIFWIKVIGLFGLLGWVLSWVSTALKERTAARGSWLDIAALVAILTGIGAIVLHVLQATGRIEHPYKVGSITLATALTFGAGLVLFLWIEATLWRTIRRYGRAADLWVLGGMHLALALGIAVGLILQQSSLKVPAEPGAARLTWHDGVVFGVRLSGTFMGYVVLLRVAGLILRELVAVRWRRLYSIAHLTVVEAIRRMWAPWVVIAVFLVVLAFTHWFLQPPRPAEMGRLYVGTLALLCSLLLTVMVTLLTPLSLPTDIQQQTIYTVVSKPVRRIELIWGRMIGFMAIVTVLVGVFGGISLLYLWRTVGGTIVQTERLADEEQRKNHLTQANHLKEEAEQLRLRMSAREPILGSLTFLDSRGNPHLRGIDVGMDQGRRPRSHIEGATPATAIWRFGVFPDPYDPNGRHILDHRIPVDRLLTRDSIEWWLDKAENLKLAIGNAEHRQAQPNLPAAEAKQLSTSIATNRQELKDAQAAYDRMVGEAKDLLSRAAAAEKAGKATEAETFRRQANALHSPDVPIEMTFNVYRTTKGKIGEPVFAEMEVTNPYVINPPDKSRWIFPIREYYTNRQYIPASLLAGSHGALKVEVRCLNGTQYLGMAEPDLYILARAGNFGTNYMKGLFGVWLQAMVLTAIGVFAGTFLSWPVALLTTVAFFVAGQVAFQFLLEFSNQSLVGGGPFESLIRLLTHDNQMSELAPTLAVVTAKTFDSIVMPVMSRLVYIVPNFSALDVSNTVSEGFEVRWSLLGINFLLALAYAVPFSIAGYFILKNREVAA